MAITRTFRVVEPSSYDLGDLSAAERLWLWRHRQRSERARLRRGQGGDAPSRGEISERLGVSPGALARLEEGAGAVLTAGDVESLLAALGRPLAPTTPELLLVARRRSGLTLAAVREEIGGEGTSRPRLLARERVADPSLVAFWESRGFRFPPAGAGQTR